MFHPLTGKSSAKNGQNGANMLDLHDPKTGM